MILQLPHIPLLGPEPKCSSPERSGRQESQRGHHQVYQGTNQCPGWHTFQIKANIQNIPGSDRTDNFYVVKTLQHLAK